MKTLIGLLLALTTFTAMAQNYPAPQVLPELKLHYRTIGDKSELAKLFDSAPRRGQ